jgi:hypothetical protein
LHRFAKRRLGRIDNRQFFEAAGAGTSRYEEKKMSATKREFSKDVAVDSPLGQKKVEGLWVWGNTGGRWRGISGFGKKLSTLTRDPNRI